MGETHCYTIEWRILFRNSKNCPIKFISDVQLFGSGECHGMIIFHKFRYMEGEILVIPESIMLWTYFVIIQISFLYQTVFSALENSNSVRSFFLFVETDIHLIQCLLIFFIFYVPDVFQFSELQNISESVIITINNFIQY